MQNGSESALRRLAVVLKDSNDAITIQDLRGNIVAWNKGAEKLYGYTEDEALKMNVVQFVPCDQTEIALEYIYKKYVIKSQ
ncbi:MAG TPA: PAS domain S-box protein [Smithellaceae bacterium]|nr:PAS domain S-box protein [Smithellaceae bacterium]